MRKQYDSVKQYKQRTVPKKKWKFFGAVLLFILLLPYVCATFMGSVRTYETKIYSSPITVIRKTDMGTEYIPMEEYLIGVLAAAMSPSYETEALKAQAVILRTMVYKQYEGRKNKHTDTVSAEELHQEYMTLRQMKELWGEKFEPYYMKLCSAVEATEGCTIRYENIAVDTPYFLLSAGMTRNGNEAFASAAYPYLQSVESRADILSPEYLCIYSYDKNQFMQKVEALLREYGKEYGNDTSVGNRDEAGNVSGNAAESGSTSENTVVPDTAIPVSEIGIKCDSSGYVLFLQIGQEKISGEFFRNFFHVNSSCFTIEEKMNTVEITTKGIGHGVGMSQYGANEMAKSGEDFTAILQHYFTNVQIQRN